MLKLSAHSIAQSLIDNGIIENESRELYEFGINQMIVSIINLFITLVIGLCFHMVWQLFLFMLTYIPLRKFSGGIHAQTQFRCYIASIVMLCLVCLILKYLNISIVALIIIYSISAFTIVFLSPIEDQNKPLDIEEHKVYKKISIILLIIESLFAWVFYSIGLVSVAQCMLLVFDCIFVMLILGHIKKIKRDKS